MKTGKIYLGTFTKIDSLNASKKASREMELQNSIGWSSTHKVHKSVKDYTRKVKHKSNLIYA
jgi:hypothetical protein